MKKLNVGVIGAGYWGKKIVGEYTELAKENQEVNVQSVCDMDEANLFYCREHFGITHACHDYMEILKNQEV